MYFYEFIKKIIIKMLSTLQNYTIGGNNITDSDSNKDNDINLKTLPVLKKE